MPFGGLQYNSWPCMSPTLLVCPVCPVSMKNWCRTNFECQNQIANGLRFFYRLLLLQWYLPDLLQHRDKCYYCELLPYSCLCLDVQTFGAFSSALDFSPGKPHENLSPRQNLELGVSGMQVMKYFVCLLCILSPLCLPQSLHFCHSFVYRCVISLNS